MPAAPVKISVPVVQPVVVRAVHAVRAVSVALYGRGAQAAAGEALMPDGPSSRSAGHSLRHNPVDLATCVESFHYAHAIEDAVACHPSA